MRKFTVGGEGPIRLKAWVDANLPAVSKRALASLMKNRDIRVNGRRTGEDVELRPGDEVALYASDAVLEGPPLEVVWLSEGLMVAVKPPGVSSRAEGEADMERIAGDWLRKRGEDPCALACHRLDNRTGGLMMLARSAAVEAAVRALMEAGKIRKTYLCIVKGAPEPPRGTLKAWMRKDEARSRVTVFDRPMPGAKTAVTEYARMKTDGERSLLEVTLHTGRTHQIRAHMAHIGHPVLGDDKYGDREFNRQYRARRQKLWASRLEFAFAEGECPELPGLAGQILTSEAPFASEL